MTRRVKQIESGGAKAGENSNPLSESATKDPMGRFKALTRRLIRVPRDELKAQERLFRQRRKDTSKER
jgi:hypothetical protein